MDREGTIKPGRLFLGQFEKKTQAEKTQVWEKLKPNIWEKLNEPEDF